ncbi:T9SS type A sorting domain-containing protein [Nibribacter ruber]|uniref:T9SS type A sorting domain-containing protein n=2 Tax=Nibribacter ruber TaxID=2698458 RepID=A0A6P1NXL0_9BACT|nr:T9SS type A sorting domain-containing protein [Nibribacter ruber]
MPTVTAAGSTYTYYAEARNSCGFVSPSRTAVRLTINKKALTVTVTAQDKVYDGTTSANASLSHNALGSDVVNLASTGATFADKNVGPNKVVTVAGISIAAGGQGSNYTLSTTSATGSASITARPLKVTATASGKTYDGTTATTAILASDKIGEDIISLSYGAAEFSDKNAGTGKTVSITGISMSGAGATNYTLFNTSTTAVASITRKALSLSGVSAETKVYDGSTMAALVGSPSLPDAISTDDISVDISSMAAAFDTKTVGVNKAILITNPTAALTGNDKINYTLTTNVKGAITPLAITGVVTVGNKVYDKTTTGSISSKSLEGKIGNDVVSLVGGTASFEDENVGTGKMVTVTGLGLSGADAGNYTVNATATTTADIAPRAVVLTVHAQNRDYDGTTNASATISTNILAGDNLGVEYGDATFASKNVGTHAVTVSGITFVGTDRDNYEIPTGAEASGTATISKKALTLANASANDKVYDRTNAAIISGDLVGVISEDEVAVAHAGAFNSVNVGIDIPVSVTSTLSGADAGNYSIAQPAGLKANITPKELTVVNAIAQDKVYNANRATTITATLDGVIAPDVVTLVGKGTFQSSTVGYRSVTPNITISGANAGNYVLLTQPGGLFATITPKPISVSSPTAQSKEYDGTVDAAVNGALTGVESEDIGAVSLSLVGAFNNKNVGTGKPITVTGTLAGSRAINYDLAEVTGLAANITPKGLTVSGVTAISREYDRTTIAKLQGTPVLTGVISGDNVAFNPNLLTASFTDKTVGVNKPVSVSGNALTGTDAGNYTFSQLTGLTATITAKPVTILSASVNNKVYDATTSATLNGSMSGVISGDAVTLSKVANFVSPDAGTGITVNSTSTLAGGDAGNYVLTQPTGIKADILRKALSITSPVAQSKTYDKTNAATITGNLTGLAGSDVVSYTPTGTFASVNVGTGIEVTFTGGLTGAKSGNYTLNIPTGLKANITPRGLTIANVKAQDKIYDRTTAAVIKGDLTGVLAGDVVVWDGTGTFASARVNRQNQNDPVDPIPVAYNNGSLGGIHAGNYSLNLTSPSGLSAKILPKVLTPIVEAYYTIEYGGTPDVTISTRGLTGVISPDFVSLYINFSLINVNVGEYQAIPLSLSIGSTDKNNYDLSPNTAYANIRVTARSLAVSASGANKVYDGDDVASVSFSDNRIAGDDITITYASAKFDNKNAGTNKPISIAGLAISGTKAANYVLPTTPVSATGTITKRPLTINGLTANDKEYDGIANVLGFTGTAAFVNMVAGDNLNLVGTASGICDSKDAGSRVVTLAGLTHGGTDAGNYTFTLPVNMAMRINPKAVTGSFTAEDKLWDGTTIARVTSVTINGRVGADDVSFSGKANFIDADMGEDKPVVFDFTSAQLSGLQRANYVLTSIANAAADIINPLPVTLVSFTGKAQKNQVILNWTTATEINNEYFQVERSADGKNFNVIGKVKGSGNSSMVMNYTFQDASPLDAIGYYRLKQVDYDGKFEYSKVISVQVKGTAPTSITVKAYPNPTTDKVQLDFAHLSNALVLIQVLSLDGHVVQTQEVPGGHIHTLDLTALANGTYLLKLTGKEVNTFLRVVKR